MDKMLFTTEIYAIDPLTDEFALFAGPNVPGISYDDATRYCQENGLGYCKVTGILVEEIPLDKQGNPDFKNKVVFYNKEN